MNRMMGKLLLMVMTIGLVGEQACVAASNQGRENVQPYGQHSNKYSYYAPYLLGGAALGAGLGSGAAHFMGYAAPSVYRYAFITGLLGLLSSGAYRYFLQKQEEDKLTQQEEEKFADFIAYWIRNGGITCHINMYIDSNEKKKDFQFYVNTASVENPKKIPLFDHDESMPGIVPAVPRIIKAFKDTKIGFGDFRAVNGALFQKVGSFDRDRVTVEIRDNLPTDYNYDAGFDANVAFLVKISEVYGALDSRENHLKSILELRDGKYTDQSERNTAIKETGQKIFKSLNKKNNNRLGASHIMPY